MVLLRGRKRFGLRPESNRSGTGILARMNIRGKHEGRNPPSAGKSSRTTGGKSSAGKRGRPAKGVKLRVIGGDHRGRTIHYHGEDFTRPMKDNIRENLFNILGRAVRGANCFDMFAGTGALGFEAISRGAASAVMVEQNRQAVKCIEKTGESLEVSDRVRVIAGDSFRHCDSLLGPPGNDTPWIVFVCPPYALWHESLENLSRMIQQVLDNAPPGSVLVAEMEKTFDPGKLPAGEWDLREYGGTRLAFTEPAMRCGLRM